MSARAEDMSAYVVSHLDEAIEKGWIRPFYQPVIRTVSGKVCGMEALARWDDPVHGLLPPIVFIEALEDARLIHKLDMCMVNQVCRQISEDLRLGRPVVPVSFNFSRLDFDLCDVHALVEEAVRSNEIPRSYVNVEITESVFGASPTFMAAVIDRFHDIGYQVWMDDFGSAYSSLNVLKDFEFDEIKIDLEFLNSFGEKSRTIIASVVDMAKRLGIQTLAEGVETAEHAEFLHHIGCEKQQGFFYGRPEPYSLEYIDRLNNEMGIERQDERQYYHTIGGVNTLSLSERDFMPDVVTKDYVTNMPLAFIEYDGTDFKVLDYNEPFAQALQCVGIPDVKMAEFLINDTTRLPARTARRLVKTIEAEGFSRHDYVTNGYACVMRAKHVATRGNYTTVLITINSAESTQEQHRRDRMQEALEALYTIYEHVDIIHLDEGYTEPVFSQASFKKVYDISDLNEAVRIFAENEVYPADRERYLAFIDPSTMAQRVKASKQGFVVGFFRMRDQGGNYTWKLIALLGLDGQVGNDILICIRDTNWDNDALFQAAYENDGEDEIGRALDSAHMEMTDGSLWRALMQDAQFGAFWKDTDRRFVGCNQKFLDHYGFDSVDAILGKNDEDMGWHVDPTPYKNDELRVLNEGASTDSVLGHCIVQGELHNIVASKRPVYRNGRIVGLVGYFIDVAAGQTATQAGDSPNYADAVTDTLNYGGLDAATGRYIEAYERMGTDFAMIMLDLDNFKHYNEQYGYEFGDAVLRKTGQVIRGVVGNTCVLGHLYAARFVVLKQEFSLDEMEALAREIAVALSAVSEVEGTPTTLYSHYGIAYFSEANSLDSFKRLGRDRLHQAQSRYR